MRIFSLALIGLLQREFADEQVIAPLIARARSELGESAFAAAYAAGRALSSEDALAEVRAWLEQAVHHPSGEK